MDGVTPVNASNVKQESISGHPGQIVPTVLFTVTKTVEVLTSWHTGTYTGGYDNMHILQWWITDIFIVNMELNQEQNSLTFYLQQR